MPVTPTVSTPPAEQSTARQVFEKILWLARDYKKQVFLISLFALLATAADLIQPLIYKHAINDVTGLAIGQAQGPPEDGSPIEKEKHQPGKIAVRTPEQTFQTLLISVVLLPTPRGLVIAQPRAGRR